MDNKIILARNLRKNSTIQERRLWNLLKNRQFYNLKLKRQHPIGDYIVDFICKNYKTYYALFKIEEIEVSLI